MGADQPTEPAAEVTTETKVEEKTIVMEATQWETFQKRMLDLETRLSQMETQITTPTPLPAPEPAAAAEPAAPTEPITQELIVENTPEPASQPSRKQKRKRRFPLGRKK